MEEKLIEFETAVLLKEKGFIEETRKAYRIFNQELKPYVCTNNPILNNGAFISAPTQSLLQKWIREVHEIHIEIRNYIEYKYKIIYLTPTFNKRGTQILSVTGSKYYNNYEDCMEQALIESLTLIK